jgi:hypothetical protein
MASMPSLGYIRIPNLLGELNQAQSTLRNFQTALSCCGGKTGRIMCELKGRAGFEAKPSRAQRL